MLAEKLNSALGRSTEVKGDWEKVMLDRLAKFLSQAKFNVMILDNEIDQRWLNPKILSVLKTLSDQKIRISFYSLPAPQQAIQTLTDNDFFGSVSSVPKEPIECFVCIDGAKIVTWKKQKNAYSLRERNTKAHDHQLFETLTFVAYNTVHP